MRSKRLALESDTNTRGDDLRASTGILWPVGGYSRLGRWPEAHTGDRSEK